MLTTRDGNLTGGPSTLRKGMVAQRQVEWLKAERARWNLSGNIVVWLCITISSSVNNISPGDDNENKLLMRNVSEQRYTYIGLDLDHESAEKQSIFLIRNPEGPKFLVQGIFQGTKWSQNPPIPFHPHTACKNLQSVWDAPSFSLESSCYCGNLCGATERSCRFGLCTIPRKYQQSNRKYRIPGDSICSTSYR